MSTRMNRPCPVRRRTVAAALSAMTLPAWAAAPATPATPTDEFLWLEDVMGERALNWVRERNKATESELSARGDYPALKRDLLSVEIDKHIVERDYQTECIDTLCREMQAGRRKLLVEMATGTG